MIRRGDVFYVTSILATGSEQSGTRPGIIVSNDIGNEHASIVEVVYTTTQRKRLLPTHVPLKSLPRPCIALCEQITTVSKERLENYIGRLSDDEMDVINKALQVSLELEKTGGKEEMNEVVKVGSHEFMEITWKGERVITTTQLADVYETDVNNIQMNYANNKERFKEGLHYFFLEGESLRRFKKSLPDEIGEPLKFVPKLYLWTHRGASRHCKILGTEKAWEQFDNLEEKYFNPHEPSKKLSAIEQLKLQGQALMEVDEKIDSVKEDLQQFKMDMPILGIEIDKITAAVKRRGVAVLGGKESAAYHDKSIRARVYGDIYKELKRQFGVATYKAIKRNECDDAIAVIDAYEVPLVLGKEISALNEDAGEYEFDTLLE